MEEEKVELIDRFEKTRVIKKVSKPKTKTKKVLRKIPVSKSKRTLGFRLMYFSMYFIALFSCLIVVSSHSRELITDTLTLIIIFLNMSATGIFLAGLAMVLLNEKKKREKKLKPWIRAVALLILSLYTIGGVSFTFLLYGPYSKFRDWLVTSAMTTMRHQHYATWFYSPKDMQKVFANNSITETKEDTNPDLIDFDKKGTVKVYKNKYEEEILDVKKGTKYKLIELDRDGYKGKMIVVYDPSMIALGISKGIGKEENIAYGQMLTTIAKDNKAIYGVNGGGFYDPDWNSRGGIPHGIVISRGKLIANNVKAGVGGGLVGFDEENRLILTRTTAADALEMGIRDAVEFGPYLIVNGKKSFIKGNGGWGHAPRTAIGQREDGIVLMVVIDGRQLASKGADMHQLTELMDNYGAVNAACMDGGTSSSMVMGDKFISNPRNGANQAKTRPIPNGWLVIDEEENI